MFFFFRLPAYTLQLTLVFYVAIMAGVIYGMPYTTIIYHTFTAFSLPSLIAPPPVL